MITQISLFVNSFGEPAEIDNDRMLYFPKANVFFHVNNKADLVHLAEKILKYVGAEYTIIEKKDAT